MPISRRNNPSRWNFSVAALLAAALIPLSTTASIAQVATCNALTMYGWGSTSGTFSSLSPFGQNLKVAEISTGNPEIHLTFNAATNLHVTVRSGTTCEGNTDLGGAFPGALTNPVPPGRATICNVTITTYLQRLNGIPQGAPVGARSACESGFLRSRLSQAQITGYVGLCVAAHCP
jgi:hypothetical protein